MCSRVERRWVAAVWWHEAKGAEGVAELRVAVVDEKPSRCRGLPTHDRQLVSQDKDLQLLRAVAARCRSGKPLGRPVLPVAGDSFPSR